MERGLTTKYDDRVNPCQRHFDHMLKLGATPGLVMPRLSKMTSDVIKVTVISHTFT